MDRPIHTPSLISGTVILITALGCGPTAAPAAPAVAGCALAADGERMVFALRALTGPLEKQGVLVSLDVPRGFGVKSGWKDGPQLFSCGAALRQGKLALPGYLDLGVTPCPEGTEGKACVEAVSAQRGSAWHERPTVRREGADPLRHWALVESQSSKSGETQRSGDLLAYHPEARAVVHCGYGVLTRPEDHKLYRAVCDTLAFAPAGTTAPKIVERKPGASGASQDNTASFPDGAAIGELARGYVTAMSKRDAKAAAAFLLSAADCKRGTKNAKDVPPCTKGAAEMEALLPKLFQHYPEGFEPAGVQLLVVKDGVYDVSVSKKGAECELAAGLMVFRFGDIWRVGIPRRVEEKRKGK